MPFFLATTTMSARFACCRRVSLGGKEKPSDRVQPHKLETKMATTRKKKKTRKREARTNNTTTETDGNKKQRNERQPNLKVPTCGPRSHRTFKKELHSTPEFRVHVSVQLVQLLLRFLKNSSYSSGRCYRRCRDRRATHCDRYSRCSTRAARLPSVAEDWSVSTVMGTVTTDVIRVCSPGMHLHEPDLSTLDDRFWHLSCAV